MGENIVPGGKATRGADPVPAHRNDAAHEATAGGPADVLNHPFGWRFLCSVFPSHLRSLKGYDEPEILPSQLSRFCLIGADAGQKAWAVMDAATLVGEGLDLLGPVPSDLLPFTAARRQRLERTIEALIALLDEVDWDTTLEADFDGEPWLWLDGQSLSIKHVFTASRIAETIG